MREQEMRMRVFRFLKARMRNMIMPATVGIGLSLGACSNPVPAVPLYGAPEKHDASAMQTDTLAAETATAGPDQAAQGPDMAVPGPDLAAPDTREVQVAADLAPDNLNDGLGRDTPIYGVDMTPPKDANTTDSPADLRVALDGSATDGGADLGSIITKYIAPIPDAAADTGGIAPVYTAVMPDAAVGKDTPPVRYMAQMPDAGPDLGLATLYQAPVSA
jgi:hypothetical protein